MKDSAYNQIRKASSVLYPSTRPRIRWRISTIRGCLVHATWTSNHPKPSRISAQLIKIVLMFGSECYCSFCSFSMFQMKIFFSIRCQMLRFMHSTENRNEECYILLLKSEGVCSSKNSITSKNELSYFIPHESRNKKQLYASDIKSITLSAVGLSFISSTDLSSPET